MSGTQDPNEPSTPSSHGEPPPPPEATSTGGEISAEERQWAMFTHLSTLIGFVVPLGSILAPLVMWLVKKDTMAFVDDQGKEALNFNITVGIIAIGLVLLTIITFGLGSILAVPLGIIVFIGWLVLAIMAGIKANEGQTYRYPFILRLVK